jgi:glycine oxidase
MDVLVIGAGVIGLGVAWRALERGLSVAVYDPEPASKASYASAGMLPPSSEMLYGQDTLLSLCLASRTRFPSFIEELESVSGLSAGYRRDGVLDVGLDDESMAVLSGLRSFEESFGIPVEELSGVECLAQEPELAPSVRGGLFSPDDGAVNPRRLTAALMAAIEARGGTLVRERVTAVEVAVGRAVGVRVGDEVVPADRIVMSAGCWSHQVGGVPTGAIPEIKPGKGQILRLRSEKPFLSHCVRAFAAGSSTYLVQRTDGELVVGSTYEQAGYDTSVTVAGVQGLLGKAVAALPGAGTLRLAETGSGLRPGSPDGLPVMGESLLPGLFLATGHSRIGVQLMPASADIMAELLATGNLPDLAKPFRPDRFLA